jgi:hypothetical protein
MNSSIEQPTAQILDFADYRRRRAARSARQSGAKRRFLWGWPASGQLTVMDFAAPSQTPDSARSHIV